MKKLGRCGRQRRHKSRKCPGISQAHLPEYVSLLQWMKNTVGKSKWKADCWYCLEPAYFNDTGRGLRATKNIYPGGTIISLPIQLMITTSTVFNSDIGYVILKETIQFTPQQLLTIFLVIERYQEDASPWFPYINTLPHEYSTPLYFSELEIKLLAPRARKSAILANERFSKAFEKMKKFIKISASSFEHLFSESDVKWAWSTVNTRSVYFQTAPHPSLILDPEESNVALAPFLDLLNHSDSSQMSAGINSRSNCYDIITQDTYKKNEQVFICYGAHDNIKLLINYGFTLPYNVSNSYVFSLDDIVACIQDDTQHVHKKLSIIKDAELDKNLVCTVDGVSWSLMTSLKIAILTWEQLSSWRSLFQGASLSQDTENLANKMTTRLIESALNKAKRHLKFVEIQPQSTYFDLLRSLSLDDVHILESSLSTFKEG